MIDFTDCKINRFKYYGGKNGGKICVIYDNKDYMIKFPPVNEKAVNDNEYSNSCISEYRFAVDITFIIPSLPSSS